MTNRQRPPSLPDQVQVFADDLGTLLNGVFRDAPSIVVTKVEPNYVVHPQGQAGKVGGVPLTINNHRLASLRVTYHCHLDSHQAWLAVQASKEWVVAEVDSTPIIRFDYRRKATSEPTSHIQIHAHRGALSHLLSRANRPNPHDMSYVRIPTGGARFRPCLADVVQMLITQIGVDALDGWQEVVEQSRSQFRAVQLKAMVRNQTELAAEALENEGYTVTRPPGGVPEPGQKSLTVW